MPDIETTPYIIGKSELTIEADNFTSAVNSAQLVPTTPTAVHRDIGGGIKVIAGTPTWVLDLGAAQDWAADSSLVHYLRLNHGVTKSAKLTPVDGGRGVTVQLVCLSTSVGGAAAAIANTTVQLPVEGQPVWDAAA